MLLSTAATSGFAGSSASSACGRSTNRGGVPVSAPWDAAARRDWTASPSTKRPGSITSARISPMAIANVVVRTKRATTRRPTLRSCATVPEEARPRMMELKTRGMTIIWISSRKSFPGKASQLATVVAVSGSTQATEGPSMIPVPMPRTMPTRTCSHRRPRISERTRSLTETGGRECGPRSGCGPASVTTRRVSCGGAALAVQHQRPSPLLARLRF